MSRRSLIAWLLAAGITMGQMVLIPLLSHQAPAGPDLETISPITMVRLDQPLPEPPEEDPTPPEAKPEAPEPVPLDTPAPPDTPLDLDLPPLALNPRLETGIPMGPPAPGAYTPGQLDQRPVPIYRARPLYPHRAEQRGITGSVKVSFIIDAAGHASMITIIEACPAGVFDESVIQAVRTSTFKPGMLAGKPVATKIVTQYGFQ